MTVTCRWCGQELVEVDNPLRPEVRHKRGQEGACPGPPVEEFETGPEVDVLRLHGPDGETTTIRVGPAGARFVLDRAKVEAMDPQTFRGVISGLSGGILAPRPDLVWTRNDLGPTKTGQGPGLTPFGPADLVLEWDVEDGGWLGALISCRFCTGTGRVPEDHGSGRVEWLGCQDCSGSGKLHRPYAAGDRVEPATPTPDDGRAVILGGPWSGCDLTRFVYFLAGALATVLLPADQVMPTEAIDEMVRRAVTAEAARVLDDDPRD